MPAAPTGADHGPPVLVIVGAPRSGTSLVYRALCLHPEAAWVSGWQRRAPRHPVVSRVDRVAAWWPDRRRAAWFPGGNAYVYGRHRRPLERLLPAPVEGEPVLRAAGVPDPDAGPVAELLEKVDTTIIALRDDLERLVSEGLDLLGWRSDVPRLMGAADALVVPSLGEGFSLVILEALACGLPVFTTPVGGSEIVVGDDGAVRADAEGVLRSALGAPQLDQPASVRAERAARHRQAASVETVAETFVELYMASAGRPGVLESARSDADAGDLIQLP